MDKNLRRAYLIELLGTFALVYFGAGVVCVNHLTTPSEQQPATSALMSQQPGLVGIALAQGLILAVALAVTVPLTGGFLNPAVTLMLWVFNRLDHVRTSWLIGAQVVGATLAGACLRFTFAEDVLRGAHVGTPHLNPLVYQNLTTGALFAGTCVELLLTFFLVFAIFGTVHDGSRPQQAALTAGLAMTAGVLFAFALTGAAANPARWFGTAFWEFLLPERRGNPFADMFPYMAGPIVGALLAGLVYFKLMLPGLAPEKPADTQPHAAEPPRAGTTHVRARK